MAVRLRFTARSDVGLVREGNEDAGYAGPHLLLVADGMGGHVAGEVASSIAFRAVVELDEDPRLAANVESTLALAVARANEALRARIAAEPDLDGMGTTLTAVLNDGERVAVAQVGDSRGYLLRDGELRQITRDQTFVQALVDEGRLEPSEARTHPQRSLLVQALDGRATVEPEIQVLDAVAGDRLLLCSDGLSDYVDDEVIARALGETELSAAVDALVQAALDAGAPDNVTCVVADVLEQGDDSAEPLAVGSGVAQGTTSAAAADDVSAHEAREAAEPRRRRRLRPWLVGAAVLVLVGGIAAGAYAWWSTQWYVGVHEDEVAIFQGVPDPVLGLDLDRVDETFPIEVDELSAFSQRRLEDGIDADDRDDAVAIVERLDRQSGSTSSASASSAAPITSVGAAS